MADDETVELPEGLQADPVPVPGRPGIFIRDMSGEERVAWEAMVREMKDDAPKTHFMAALVLCAACHADGRPMFRTKAPAALARTLNYRTLKELYDFAFTANGLGEAGVAAEKKDSGEAPTSGSGSSSASPMESSSPSSAAASAPADSPGSEPPTN